MDLGTRGTESSFGARISQLTSGEVKKPMIIFKLRNGGSEDGIFLSLPAVCLVLTRYDEVFWNGSCVLLISLWRRVELDPRATSEV